MSSKELLNSFVWPVFGAVVGLMLYAWVTKGSPLKVDWVGAAIVLIAFLMGRAFRIYTDRSDQTEEKVGQVK